MTVDWSWHAVAEAFPLLLRGLVVTLEITVLAALLSYVLGLVFAVIRMSRIPVLSQLTFLFIEAVRSTPLLVQVFMFYYVLQSQTGILLSAFLSGVIVIGVHYACYTSEVYRAGIEAVPKGQWEAATALNLPRGRVWTSVILPQAVPRVLPALGNYTIAMFKETPLLLGIGVLEMLNRAKEYGAETFRVLEAYTLAGVFFLVISYIASVMVRRLESRVGTL
ncbi:MAG: ectoine/hydroxyectoine ABC transporter permease subunit EhuD [Actinophytocola sp.]|nr:ectoine/hydroxyectoine ABC transporter permease subunit EhuD [Actinophytocola sp.]